MKPTGEQIKEFWEWCGFEYHEAGETIVSGWLFSLARDVSKAGRWVHPSLESHKSLPPIDLNNLFKYAVPKLNTLKFNVHLDKLYYGSFYNAHVNQGEVYGIGQDDSPALALLWAIYEVMKENK